MSFYREEEGERERETSMWERESSCLLYALWLDRCPDWESKWRPLGVCDNAQSTEPQWPGPNFTTLKITFCKWALLSNMVSEQLDIHRHRSMTWPLKHRQSKEKKNVTNWTSSNQNFCFAKDPFRVKDWDIHLQIFYFVGFLLLSCKSYYIFWILDSYQT